jgi:glucose-1-phosphate adenylyltransferase
MELTKVVPELNLYDRQWPIWTYQEQLPPAKFVFDNEDRCGTATDSLVSGGCIISGAKVARSVLFSDVRVNSYSNIEDSVILPKVDIGRYVTLKRVVVDKGTRIPDGMEIGVNPEQDKKRFYVTESGITLVTPDMLGQGLHSAR